MLTVNVKASAKMGVTIVRPTFMGFETARKGMSVNQKGLDITGNNLANINTNGYTRQRVDLSSVAVNNMATRYRTSKSDMAGQGVQITGVGQVRDSFLDKRFREEFCDVGYYDQTSAILGDMESALDELTSNGLKDGLAKMVTALQNFSKSPDQVTHANIFMTSAKNITQVLKQFDSKLNNILEQQKFNMQIAVNDVNAILEKVANLNESISGDIYKSGASKGSVYGPNELFDQRNVLLDQLSKYGDMRVTENSDGTVTVSMNGHTVVDGKKYDGMNLVRNPDSTVSLNWQSTGDGVSLTTGSLKAFTDMINGRGFRADGQNETFERGIPYYKDQINDMAKMLVTQFNSQVQTKAIPAKYEYATPTPFPFTATTNMSINIGGNNYTISVDPKATKQDQANEIADKLKAITDGGGNKVFDDNYKISTNKDGIITIEAKNAGVDNLGELQMGGGVYGKLSVVQKGYNASEVQKTLFEPTDINNVNAGNITISEEWSKDPGYIITDIDYDGVGDNNFILTMIDLFSKDLEFPEYTGTLEGFVNSYNTTLGQQKDFSDSRLEATAAIADEMLNRRDDVSGVSMDEEGANMMLYDKAYKAASRLMTTLDEMLDILISRTGVVGR